MPCISRYQTTKSPRQAIHKINKNCKLIVISGFFISDVIYVEDTDLVLILLYLNM